MRLSTKSQYAVMALVDLALYGKESPVRLGDIAARQSLPVPYLEQLFCHLRRAGVVTSTRGASGGYQLTSAPEDLSIGAIIVAAKEEINTTRCKAGDSTSCQGKGEQCLTHALWIGLGNRIQEYFEEISLADVAQGRIANQTIKTNVENRRSG